MPRVDPDHSERLVFRELDSSLAAWALFARRFGHPPPLDGHHVCTFIRDGQELEHLVCYIHFRPLGDILLGGGAVVDRARIRSLQRSVRDQIRANGGLYRMSLDWALRQFCGRYVAAFGYCGDALAERVDRAAGFIDTGHERLLVYWLEDCDQQSRAHCIAQAHAQGPF